MFSSLSQRLATRFVHGLDLLVELSTLGAYGIDHEGVFALDPDDAADPYAEASRVLSPAAGDGTPVSAGPPHFPRSRDDCPHDTRFSALCRDAAARP